MARSLLSLFFWMIRQLPIFTLFPYTTLFRSGDCTGTTSVTASGGTPGYTYAWSNGATTATATGLCVGTYTVTVADANGCSDTTSAVVTEPPPLTISSTPDLVLCSDDDPTSDIGVTVSGGTPTYTYQWDDPNSGTTATITVTNIVKSTTS